MKEATKEFIEKHNGFCEERKQEILNSPDKIEIKGTTYYVSNDGDDDNDGKTPQTAWKTLKKVSTSSFEVSDGVRFRRGDIFRGSFVAREGVTYAAYGEGKKPEFRRYHKNLADPTLWKLFDKEHNIWQLDGKIVDVGTIVFNEGEKHCRKLIPSYIGGKFVWRDDESREFVLSEGMTCDLDLWCRYDEKMTTYPSQDGQTFPIPLMTDETPCDLYLRCDEGNPGEVFESAEPIPRGSIINCGGKSNVKIDNLCLKYSNFGIAGGSLNVKGLHVTNCEIGWIGGCNAGYSGDDCNYPEGRRGSITRWGNGIEIYGSCDDFVVSNNYIYQVYDAGASHQAGAKQKTTMTNTCYTNNIFEHCVYGVEYFLYIEEGGEGSYMDSIEISGNIFRYNGLGWGQQRHNYYTPAHIKGWSYENPASNFSVHDNIFDVAGQRMVHMVAKEKASVPKMYCNTYICEEGMTLGKVGANRDGEPEDIIFDDNAEGAIEKKFREYNPKVYIIRR